MKCQDLLIGAIPPYWKTMRAMLDQRMGNVDDPADAEMIKSASPLFRAQQIVRPILIGQGMRDVRVVAAESEQMVTALKQRGVPVTYVTFPDEGHGFVRPENRLAFYGVTEAFLAKHLGGRYQPVGSDFAGSTLKVETGGDLVPGLTG